MKLLKIMMLFSAMLTAAANANDTVVIQKLYDIASDCKHLYLTSKHDNLNRNYLYVAAKEGGLRVYDITSTPELVKTIPISSMGGLHAMNLSQNGNYLYLALGNHFGTALQKPGMAIIDVTNPANAFLIKFKMFDVPKSGAGIIETDGNYAYLGAMKNGLFIIDISDKTNPALLSSIDPDIYFPDPNPDPKKFNARGIWVENNIVYLCYDAGGLRIINTTDKLHPIETGRYANPVMNGKARAYNNIIKNGKFVYIAVDYCGLEILDVHDTAHITQASWWNPWNCQKGALKWFNSNGHANEIAFDSVNNLVLLSSGKSDMQVVNIANSYAPVFKKEYGGINNGIGSWGVSVYGDKIYLSYICASVPFTSDWSGIKILQYSVLNNLPQVKQLNNIAGEMIEK